MPAPTPVVYVQANPNAGCGKALLWVGGICLLLFVACAAIVQLGHSASSALSAAADSISTQHPSSGHSNSTATLAHPGCDGAVFYREQAIDDFNNGRYQAGYDAAVAGLNRAGDCDDADQAAVRGMLLGNKALTEHHLSSGNSADDINQAITLLAKCQTEPGYYGEKGGAHCESEEEVLIRYKTQWEMDSY